MSRALRPLAIPAVLLLAACGGVDGGAETSADIDDGSTMFTAVRDHCDLPDITVGDGGTTLILDGQGDEDPGGLPIEDMACALNAIDTPDFIVTQIDQTRALDGRQTASHEGYSYSWTYHPDNGLDIIVTDAWQG